MKFAAFLQQALEENGQSVDAVHDGEEGLRRALAGDYDLLVLDWLLPGRDGGSLCAAVRATGNEVPILMLTARDAVHHRVAGLDAGADDYLTKPFALTNCSRGSAPCCAAARRHDHTDRARPDA